jgi:iron(III) transport system ATP-binding protein
MDEPFSNLDRRLRDSIRQETVELLRSLEATAVIVTHDPEEALSLGDRVVLMQAGQVVENGRGDQIYDAPSTPYSAEFFSRFNRIPTRRRADALETALGTFALPAGLAAAGEVLLYVRPQAIRLAATGIEARVRSCVRMGEIEEIRLDVEGLATPVVIRSSQRSAVAAGDRVHLEVDAGRVLAFPAEAARP